MGDSAIVELVPTKPLCVEKYSEFEALGKFVIRSGGNTIGFGVVISTVPKEE